MKSGALCRGLALADFGHAICTVATAGDPGDFFLSGKQRTISPISSRPNLTKFEQNMSIGAAMKTFEENFYNFTEKVVFPKNATISKKFSVLRLQAAIGYYPIRHDAIYLRALKS